MYHPDLKEFTALAGAHQIVPVYREVSADLETPVSALYKLLPAEYGFLLESVEGGEHLARYSFLGVSPEKILIYKDKVLKLVHEGGDVEVLESSDPLSALRRLVFKDTAKLAGLPYFTGGAVGYLGYDMVRLFESLPTDKPDELGLPDMVMMLCDTIIVFDHLKHKIKVIANAAIEGRNADAAYSESIAKIEKIITLLARPLDSAGLQLEFPDIDPEIPLTSNIRPDEYEDMVRKAKEYIFAGDVFQVVLAQRFEAPAVSDPLPVYRRLRTINPSPYMGFLKFGDFSFIASSPELLVKVQDGLVEVRPIAGTRPRGSDEEEDEALAKDLLSDAKERAEHLMLIDLGRNDIGRVCELGTVEVKDLMVIERYSHVMHMVSSVQGRLAAGLDCFDALKSAFPAGTVSGAPKIRAMEIIDELEPARRGAYAGVFGYFGYSGNMDTGITIRTIFATKERTYVGAGAGIVADSDPTREYMETVNKARALLTAVEQTR